MANHERKSESREDELRESASRASALIANRAATRSAGADASRAGQPRHERAAQDAGRGAPDERASRSRSSAAGRASSYGNADSGARASGAQRRSNASARASANQRSAVRSSRSSVRQRRADVAGGRFAGSPGKAQAKQNSLGAFVRHNARYIASVVAVVVLVSVGILAVRAFLPAASPPEDPAQTESPASKYDWSLLDRSSNRYRYVVNGEVKSRLGIDVSESQHEIDWDAVAQDGIDFAIVRLGYRGATEGGLYVDEHFWSNIDGARNAGLDCGVYFFSQANTVDEALEEADFVLGQLQGVSLEYPVGFDSEVVNLKGVSAPTAGLSRDEMTAIAEAFCTRVKEAGYDVLVYGNAYDLARYKPEDMTDCPLWWAEYGARSPSTTAVIDFWQYSNSGSVAGISTVVDMNLDLRNV